VPGEHVVNRCGTVATVVSRRILGSACASGQEIYLVQASGRRNGAGSPLDEAGGDDMLLNR
jgi:hypothetical protein